MHSKDDSSCTHTDHILNIFLQSPSSIVCRAVLRSAQHQISQVVPPKASSQPQRSIGDQEMSGSNSIVAECRRRNINSESWIVHSHKPNYITHGSLATTPRSTHETHSSTDQCFVFTIPTISPRALDNHLTPERHDGGKWWNCASCIRYAVHT